MRVIAEGGHGKRVNNGNIQLDGSPNRGTLKMELHPMQSEETSKLKD